MILNITLLIKENLSVRLLRIDDILQGGLIPLDLLTKHFETGPKHRQFFP
jgi:hypothetical protein